MYIGIKNGKVWDICSNFKNRRKADNGILLAATELNKIVYVRLRNKEIPTDILIDDTWDFDENCSKKDSPKRNKNNDIFDTKKEIEELKKRIELLEKNSKD